MNKSEQIEAKSHFIFNTAYLVTIALVLSIVSVKMVTIMAAVTAKADCVAAASGCSGC